MNLSEINNLSFKEFWHNLQNEIVTSNKKLSTDDIMTIIERNFMFSMYFRGCSQLELLVFQTLFNVKDNGYIFLLEFSPSEDNSDIDFDIDENSLIMCLKKYLPENTNPTIGPLLYNRICILVSIDTNDILEKNVKNESITHAKTLQNCIKTELNYYTSIGIGNLHNIHTLNSSFVEALCSLQYCESNHVLHINDLHQIQQDHHIDYMEAEKRMLEAIRLRKIEAYGFFIMLINMIHPLNDEVKRNKILEILVLSNHEMRKDNTNQCDNFKYIETMNELSRLKGNQLIEWAYHKFFFITGHAKPQNTIDYTNKIVQTTKEYLEAHYTEDISLEDVAEQVNISPQYFSKLIKKTTGFNFIDWLSMLRVKKAKELLNNSDYTVKEVCFMVGYKDPNYFSRIFKKRIGITPSEFIKNNNTHINNN